MAVLYGTLKGNRGEVSRCGSKDSGIRAMVKTWNGMAYLYLDADGTLQLDVNGMKVWTGNIDEVS